MTIQEEIELFEILNKLFVPSNPIHKWFLRRRYKELQKKYLNDKTEAFDTIKSGKLRK